MVEQSWERDWSKDFKTDCYKDSFNPSFVLAKILEQRSVGVSIIQEVVRNDKRYNELVEIQMTPHGRDCMLKGEYTPEFLALSHAKWHAEWRHKPKPKFESCQWDDATKRRVEAFYWQNVVTHYQRTLEERLQILDQGNAWYKKVINDNKKMIDETQSKVRELLDDLNPLTSEDIRSLLEEVVDRVLAQNPKA